MNRMILIFFLALVPLRALTQESSVKPSDNLVVDGIPSIPASIVEAVGRYTEFRSAGFQSWNPIHREMLISTRFADAAQIHLVKMPGGARTQLTFFPERVTGASFNPVRDDYFIFSKDVGGGEWFQNYRYDVASGNITLLTDGKSRNSSGIWSQDGSLLAYTSTRRNGKDTDLYTINPTDPSTDRLLVQLEGGGWNPSDWSPDGTKIVVGEYISINESYLWLVDAETGAKTLLTPKGGNEQISYGSVLFSTDGRGLYVTTDRESEYMRLAYLDLATMGYRFLTTNISWDVTGFDLSHVRSTLAFITNEDGVGVLHLLNMQTGKELPVPKLPSGIVSGATFHPALPYLAFNLSSAKSSADAYTLDLTNGRIERWTTSEIGGLNAELFPNAELVRWKSFDGKMISGFLYRPPTRFSGKRPVIVNIHGGPESQSRPTFLGRNNYFLNEMGVAMIFPNVRGSSGYGKTYLKLDNGYRREDSYKDIAALLDWIKKQPELDGERIMITGGSYGGHATLAASTFYSDKLRCAVDVVGMSNLVTFLERTESYRRDLRRVEYGDERDAKMREFLERIAPLNNAEKIKKPLFVIQGKNDPRVPASEADQIVAALKKSDTPVWYLMATDEGHGFAKKKNQDFQFYATVMFMKEYLLK